MLLEAFAKINWSLDITGVRDDGYHIMDMLMQPVSVADDIVLDPAPDLTISVSGWPPVKADENNLAFRAALALKKASGYHHGAAIHVRKQIPVGAGMGGGSADAAAVLVGLNLLWKTGLSQDELESIGLTLGADVPFFIHGGLTRTRGIGEKLEDLDYLYDYRLVVLQPCSGLSTAQVFQKWRSSSDIRHPDTDAAQDALKNGQLPLLCESIGNVLQPIAEGMRPEIVQACCSLKEHGALTAIMTGSGSAVFGVFVSESIASKAFNALRTRYKTIFLCHTQHDSIRISQE